MKWYGLCLTITLIISSGCARHTLTEKPLSTPRPLVTVAPPLTLATPRPTPPAVRVDSELTLQQALAGREIPGAIERQLTLAEVEYWGFDEREHRGQLVIRRDLSGEVAQIFREIKQSRFPIEKVMPVVHYDWSDEATMAANNSSAFNFRRVQGQRQFSRHAFGCAIDINPRLNPHVKKNSSQPPGATYDPSVQGTITEDGPVVAAFRKYGWTWGGDWRKSKDWQHFEKP